MIPRILVVAFRKGLGESGFVEGQNVTIEYRWAFGQYGQLPAMAAEFVRRPVSIIVATGGEPAALAAQAATSTIPIIFAIGGDPVRQGLAANFIRPGGNTTGITLLTNQLEPKRLGLLRQLVPQAATIGFLLNPSFSPSASQLTDVQDAARAMALQIQSCQRTPMARLTRPSKLSLDERIAALAVAASHSSTPPCQARGFGGALCGAHDLPLS